MAAERLLDEKQPDGYLYLKQLNEQLLLKRCNIVDLKKQWYEQYSIYFQVESIPCIEFHGPPHDMITMKYITAYIK